MGRLEVRGGGGACAKEAGDSLPPALRLLSSGYGLACPVRGARPLLPLLVLGVVELVAEALIDSRSFSYPATLALRPAVVRWVCW